MKDKTKKKALPAPTERRLSACGTDTLSYLTGVVVNMQRQRHYQQLHAY